MSCVGTVEDKLGAAEASLTLQIPALACTEGKPKLQNLAGVSFVRLPFVACLKGTQKEN